ncbi:MAG: hypothetical protein M1836_001853 [Candelina mexicana]|nr:MAG: hypothetical protein M1836_001853 [Candelina mexicana]
MFISKEELRRISNWICEVLDPQINRDDGDVLDHDMLRRLRTFLAALESTAIRTEDIHYSHIDKALLDICDANTKWPVDLVVRAEKAVQALEQRLGPLRNLRLEAPSASGRHLKGEVTQDDMIQKIKAYDANNGQESRKNSWLLSGGDLERAYTIGHSGFEVGDWWIETTYAYQDGIIDDSRDGITADEDGAYAIVVRDDHEIDSGRPDMMVYRATGTGRGKFMLMRNLNSRACVRVLRSSRSKSEWAPRAGVRYDGLYVVTGYGVKLDTIQKDEWVYTFRLSREEGQPSMEKALRHPTAEEYNSRQAYEKEKNGRRSAELSLRTTITQMAVLTEDVKGRAAEGDEGYFSSLTEQ